MIVECPKCFFPLLFAREKYTAVQRFRKNCSVCRAVVEITLTLVKDTDMSSEELEARRNTAKNAS